MSLASYDSPEELTGSSSMFYSLIGGDEALSVPSKMFEVKDPLAQSCFSPGEMPSPFIFIDFGNPENEDPPARL